MVENNPLQCIEVDITTHQQPEQVVGRLLAKHQLIPIGNVEGTGTPNRKHSIGKVCVLIKRLFTELTVTNIPYYISLRVSPYLPVWVELCGMF